MNRSRALDVIRALAIFLVLGRHVRVCPEEFSPLLNAASLVMRKGGWVGVDLFFVLSGYLISSLLFKEFKRDGRISFMRFFVRRGFKIYPPFYLMIFISALWAIKYRVMDIHHLLAEICFVQNYFEGLWVHTWSLAVEEHFYLLLPPLLIVLYRASRDKGASFRMIPWVFCVVAASCLAFRLMTSRHQPVFSQEVFMFPSHLRFDSLFFGVLISYLHHFAPAKLDQPSTAAGLFFRSCVGCACFVPAYVFSLEGHPSIYTWGYGLLYVGSGLLLTAAISGERFCEGPVMRALAYIGSHSYSIYLWHMFMEVYGVPWFEKHLAAIWSWPVYGLVYVGGSVLVGILLAMVIETPVLKIRDRYFPSRSGPALVPVKRGDPVQVSS